MSEAQKEQAIRVPHQPIMRFYNGIKEIQSLYPKLRSIQESIDEEGKVFGCQIRITEPLSPTDEAQIKGDILVLIQDIILPTLPAGFQSTVSDITFVVGENAPRNVENTTSRFGGIVRKLFGSSVYPDAPELFTGEAGLRDLCEKAQEMSNITVRYTIIPGNTVIFTIYGSAPRDQADITTFLSINLPKEFSLVVNESVSFAFKPLRDLEEEK